MFVLSVPSVATIAGTRPHVTSKPLSAPRASPRAQPIKIPTRRLVPGFCLNVLAATKAAKPTMDFDGRYGADTGSWTTNMFVEAVYQGLKKS